MSSNPCLCVPAWPCSPPTYIHLHFPIAYPVFPPQYKGEEILPNLQNLRLLPALTFRIAISMAFDWKLNLRNDKGIELRVRHLTVTSTQPLHNSEAFFLGPAPLPMSTFRSLTCLSGWIKLDPALIQQASLSLWVLIPALGQDHSCISCLSGYLWLFLFSHG